MSRTTHDSEVFNKYYPKMLKSLQMNKDYLFLVELPSLLLAFPAAEKKIAQSDDDKAKYYLSNRIRPPLERGNSEPFEELLSAMEKFRDTYSKTLSQEIKQKLRPEQPHISTKKREQEILRSMLKAREEKCSIKVRYGKVLFCGAGAAGKTNFLNLLMKKDFEQKHKSTELVNPQQVTIAMKAVVSSNHDEIVFTKMDINEEIHQLMSYLPKKYTEQVIAPHHVDHVQKDVSENSITAAERIMSEKIASESDPSELTNQVSRDEWDVLTFMDTGGQPQFISMLPTVNSFAMITFIVHKLTGGKKSLDDKVMVQHGNQQGENSFTPHTCECTYIQLIKTLMSYTSSVLLPDVKFLQEIACKTTTNNTSNISIIGTHSADVSTDDIKEIDKTLADMINNADCKNIKPNLNKAYEYLAPVDNKDQIERNKSDSDTDIKKYTNPSVICKHIFDFQMKQNVYSVPIQWLLLEIEIRKVCIDKGRRSFITYRDVLELATEKKLGNEEFIKDGLRFHHLFGVLLYFEDVEGMRELVITDHQWLFNKLTEIVLYSFKFDSRGDRNLHIKGMFKDEMLKDLNVEKDFKKAKINTKAINPKKSFLNLLKHLKIIAPLNEEETIYFMPSILKSHPITGKQIKKAIPKKNSFKYQSNENVEAEPFLFQLEPTTQSESSVSLIPRGFFCFLVVELVRSTRWQPYKENLYDNLVTFFKVEGSYYVTIIDKIFFLEVHITHENGNVNPIHYEVLKIMHNTMVVVERSLSIRCIIKHGFLCKKCSDTEQQHLTYVHMTHINEDGVKYVSPTDDKFYDCVNQKQTPTESSHQIWLQKTKKLQGVTPQEKNMNCDYETAAEYLRKHIGELSKLPYKAMEICLYSKKVITLDQKELIASRSTNADKMQYLIIEILIASLEIFPDKFMGFLAAMETSDDTLLQKKAQDIKRDLKIQ